MYRYFVEIIQIIKCLLSLVDYYSGQARLCYPLQFLNKTYDTVLLLPSTGTNTAKVQTDQASCYFVSRPTGTVYGSDHHFMFSFVLLCRDLICTHMLDWGLCDPCRSPIRDFKSGYDT